MSTAHLKAVFTLPVLAVLFSVGAQAQPASLVKDLNTTHSGGISTEFGPNTLWEGFAALGNTVFFGASDGIHGYELWRSDGTVAGTRLVADVCPGSCASTPRDLAIVGGKIFFVASDGFHGPEVWKTDGTAAGTALVRDLIPPGGNPFTRIHGLTELNGKLLFSIAPPGGRHQLWTSDGTAAGTVLVKDFEHDGDSNTLEPLARADGKVLFIANDEVTGREFWATDGTPAGTLLLQDINPGLSGSAPGFLEKTAAVAGGKLFFFATGPEGYELRVSDGTPAGTALVKDIAPGPATYAFGDLTALGDEVFFLASEDGQVFKLWKSDGTAGGTRAVQTVPRNSRGLTAAGGRLFFLSECELWTSDGTPAGTRMVKEIRAGSFCDQPVFSTQQGRTLLFFANDGIHGRELWKSDGTPAGTSLVADLNPGAGSTLAYHSHAFAGGRWFFRAERGENAGTQLWTTNATAAGTRMLTINRQTSAFHVSSGGNLVGPRAFFDLDGTLLFQGGNGATGPELGRSDGTAAGTRVVKDLQTLPGLPPSLPGEFTRAGGTVFFRTGAGTGGEKLWKTDGTRRGTQVLYAPGHLHFGGSFTPRDPTPVGGQLLFVGLWGDDFLELLLKSDGTEAGTTKASEAVYVQSIVSLTNNLALFQADEELWRSDGTDAGTAPLATGPSLPNARSLKDVSGVRDGVLVFAGSTPENGEELWGSDGTEAGTRLLAEIVPGLASKPLGPFASAGPAVFFAAGGDELWKNDAAGTALVRKLPSGDPAFGIRSLTPFGNRVYFTYHDHARGHELWVSDGTQAGTRIVRDVLPGPGSSHPRHLRVEGSLLLFSASDGVHGFEPWRSDGTRRGTRMLQDIAPGALSSSPTEFTASGSNVYFTANDGTRGFELWAIPKTRL